MPQLETSLQQGAASFLQSLQPVLQQIEDYRKEKYQEYLARIEAGKRVAIVIAVVLCVLFLSVVRLGDGSSYIAFVGLTGFAIYSWVIQPKTEYQKSYKQKVMPLVAQSLGLDQYLVDGTIPVDDMLATKILPAYDMYKSEDFF